jgi:ABC-2 type transport system ATP-binding protein
MNAGASNAASSLRHAISVRGVGYRYAHAMTDALRDVTLDIPRGEIFGLLGPNGAGKSTLLGLLSGSLAIQSGSIEIAGEALPRRARQVKRISAVVPQEYAFYESLTGLQNLDYFGDVFGVARAERTARRTNAIDICRLADDVRRPAGDLSGGLKRRLNLAIGLLNAPQILYLDEPTVGIDAESRGYILDAVLALKASGTTIVYTSHYMEEVERLCDCVAVIDHGRVVLQDRVTNLLRREGGESLQITLSMPRADLAPLFDAFAATNVDFKTWKLTVSSTRLPQLLAEIERQGARIERMQYGVSRLEEIYLDLLLSAGQKSQWPERKGAGEAAEMHSP